jgi:hypothetical protein
MARANRMGVDVLVTWLVFTACNRLSRGKLFKENESRLDYKMEWLIEDNLTEGRIETTTKVKQGERIEIIKQNMTGRLCTTKKAGYNISSVYIHKQNRLRGLSPRANYTDQATAACRRS